MNLKNKIGIICLLDHEQHLHFYCFIISGLKKSQYTGRLRPEFRVSSNRKLVKALLNDFA